MDATKKIMDMLCDEMEGIAKKGQLSAGDLDAVYKMSVAKEKLLRCEELEEKLGHSEGNGNWNAQGSYARGRRGSYGTGSYTNARDMMADNLREMSYDSGLSQRERDILQRAESEMRGR